MERIELKEGLGLSRLVYGMWRLGDDADRSPAHVQRKIELCLEQGITTFDQADIYGDYESEPVFGEALKASPSLRKEIEIVTKCDIKLLSSKYPERRVKYYDTSAEHIRASVDTSLERMKTDYVDVLLIHRPDPLMDHRETGAVLDELIASGKIRAAGVSNFKLHDWTLLQSAMSNKLVTNQIEASLVCTEPFVNGDIAYLQERGIPPMAWSPLGGGRLVPGQETPLGRALARVGAEFGVDASAVAVAWLLKHPANILPVLGTNALERIAKISDALKVEMDRETWFELYTLANGHDVP
ncbi:aldo/keto reductase [Pseudovibrio sp. SPO723]|uniref:aldo/keto reductase n=1 Tax=Nesiotobacter zosterae TaxID=392721 RepID=UPI0029C1942B|nr:aldo/keto reductase [Pseudovibrio sp. SPO723]MDX5592426.1 aldo/keto reductase [Pseudovibrio sp. SPO723]